MRDPEGLLDTSALPTLGRLPDASMLPAGVLISAVTLAELSMGPLIATDDAERAPRLAHVQQAQADFDPVPFDAAAARAFGIVASGTGNRAANAQPVRSMP